MKTAYILQPGKLGDLIITTPIANYYKNNIEAIKERHSQYYENNKEKCKDNDKEYYKNNKDKKK